MERNADILKVRELIRDIEFAMLTTIDENGNLISRPMATQQAEFDGDLWFFTRDDAPKAQHVNQDRHVNVTYCDPKSGKYISLSGKAAVYFDHDKAREMWNPAYQVWFEKGLDDPHLALLKVRVTMAEYWEGPRNPVTRLIGFAKGLLTDDKTLGGDHRKLAMGQ